MNDAIFLKNFVFNEYCFNEICHRDNTRGIDCHCIGFMKHGRGLIVSDNVRFEINPDEMFYIPKGLRYHSYWSSEDYVKFDSIGFLYFPSNAISGYSLQKINYNKKIFDAFLPLSVSKEVNTKSIGQLYTLLGLIENKLKPAPTNRRDEIANRFLQLINENHQRTIADYAAMCNVSEPVLYQYTKDVLNKTPNRLRQEYACQKAINLLISTSLSIEKICTMTGFSSASYFRKILYSIHGKTPSQIRKDNKNGM